jgi:hypothetical protein
VASIEHFAFGRHAKLLGEVGIVAGVEVLLFDAVHR